MWNSKRQKDSSLQRSVNPEECRAGIFQTVMNSFPPQKLAPSQRNAADAITAEYDRENNHTSATRQHIYQTTYQSIGLLNT